LEVIDKLISVFGAGSVGVKVSPCGRFNDMFDSNPLELYKYFLGELGSRRVAFVEVMQPPDFRKVDNLYGIKGEDQIANIFKDLKPYFVYNTKHTSKKENDDTLNGKSNGNGNGHSNGNGNSEHLGNGKHHEKTNGDDEKNLELVENVDDYEPTFIANNSLDLVKAQELLENGFCDMVTFGRLFISNPDLIVRLKSNLELTPPNYDTFYTPGEEGYISYQKYQKSEVKDKEIEIKKEIV